jgi:ribonuclease E
MATCPECEFDEIDTEDFDEGDTLSCPECGKSLVLLGADELESADADDDDDDEDLDDDEDEDEDLDDDEDDLDDDEDEGDDEEDFDE